MSETLLPTIWFLLWGLLWAIYFSLDSFDLGAGMLAGLLPSGRQQQALIRTLGPFWDGNGVWLITAGGVTFAAFPTLYAVMFSSLYGPLIIILLALVCRAVAIEFYHQSEDAGWHVLWARILALGSLLVALLFGVAFGNIFQGLLLDTAGYHGNILSLLNPYGLLTGILFVVAFMYSGSLWAAYKSSGDLGQLGYGYAQKLYLPLLAVAVVFLAYTPFATDLLGNYLTYPVLFIGPVLAVLGLLASGAFLTRKQAGLSLVAGGVAILFLVLSCIIGLYPNVFPSKIDPAASLTVFNAASSPYTLRIMLIVTVIFLPLVLVYQIWHYKVFAPVPAEEGEDY